LAELSNSPRSTTSCVNSPVVARWVSISAVAEAPLKPCSAQPPAPINTTAPATVANKPHRAAPRRGLNPGGRARFKDWNRSILCPSLLHTTTRHGETTDPSAAEQSGDCLLY